MATLPNHISSTISSTISTSIRITISIAIVIAKTMTPITIGSITCASGALLNDDFGRDGLQLFARWFKGV